MENDHSAKRSIMGFVDIVVTIGALAAIVSAIYAIMQYTKGKRIEKPDVKMGFAKGGQIVNQMEVRPDKTSGTQRVFFRIHNGSDFSVKTPICSVRFPEAFKHRRFRDKEDGTREELEGFTVNSDLWGLGRGSTNINMNLPDSMWEIYGMPALLLRSGESIEFFIRFAVPDKPMTYALEMKLDAEGTRGFTQRLTLIVNTN